MTNSTPPNSPEAESRLLGCLLLDPKFVTERLRQLCPTPADLFYGVQNQSVASEIIRLVDSREQTDLGAIVVALERSGDLERCGGYDYLAKCQEGVSSAAEWPFHAKTASELLSRRRVIAACAEISMKARSQETDVTTLLDDAEASMLKASRKVDIAGDADSADAVTMIMEATQYAEERMEASRNPASSGLSGFWFDHYGLWIPGNMVVIGARPGVGKTTLALNIVANACEMGIACGMVSLEMRRSLLMLRLAARKAAVDSSAIYRRDGMSEEDHLRLSDAFEKMARFKFFCDDRCGLNIFQIRTALRTMKARHNIGLGVIDYLQLIAGMGREERREEAIAKVSTGIKSLARELEIPIIVVAALNRELEKVGGRDPRQSDLRGSGQIESDADAVILMHAKPDPPVDADVPVIETILSKNRHGPQDVRRTLLFNKKHSRFQDV